MIESHYTEEINTAGQLEFTLPSTMRLPQNVFFVCITDPNDETSYLMFKIITEKVTDEKVTYTCIENAYDELASYTYIKDKRPTAIASAMLQMVLDGTRWSVGTCPEVSPKFCSFYYISVLEAIQKIVNLWGFEVQFQVKIDGVTNEIKQRNINLYTKLGKRTNKRFEYGSNLLSVTQANDSTGLYTALVGRGKGVQVSSGDTDTDPDGYGRRITFVDVVWSTQSGNPLNKPAGQEYLEDPNATAAYGFPDGHPRIGFVVFQDCEDPNELIQLTYNKLQEVNHPQVQFSANIADVGSLNLGDTIAIIRHDIGIEYYTRVFKVVHDLLDSSNNTVELGDNIAGSNSITQQISTIKDNQSNVQNAIDTIVMNGADGNKLFFGTEFPANGTDGDIFYKTLENGGTEMYIYKNGGWQLVVSTEELDTVQKKVDEQTSQIQQAVDSANSAVSKANSLSTTVGTVEDTLQNVQKTVSEANEQMSASISSAQNDIAAIQKQVNDNGADISEIKQTQSSITSNVATLQGETSQLKQTANELQATVGNNSGDISTLKQTASELQNTVGNNSGDISQLKQTSQQIQVDLTNANGNISELQQTANQISLTITNLSIGGNNLLNNTADFSNWQIGDKGGAIENGEQYNLNTSVFHGWLDNGNAWAAAPNEVYLEAGKEYTFSALVWDNSSVTNPNYNNNVVNLRFDNDEGALSYLLKLTSKTNHTPQVYSVTFTVGTSGKYHGFKLIDSQSLLGGSLWSAQYMLQSGNKATAWQQSAADNASKADIVQIKETINGIQTTVSSQNNDISQLTQTAQSFQSNISSAVGPYVQNANFRDANIKKYWSPWDTTTDYTNITYDYHHPDGYPASLCLHIQPNGTTKAITTDYIKIDPNSTIVVSLQNACGWSGNKPQTWLYVHFYDNNKNETSSGNCELNIPSYMSWAETKGTWTAEGNEYYIRIEIVLTGTIESWLYATGFEVASGNNGITSQISQLADDINLRVQKGDLISQINIEAGKTLIQSDKLYLDASSVVFSGNAFIPSAAITDLSADKITTGTLNAANVHVINMDVANLVGDTTSFVRSQWQNAYGANVNIDGSGMSVGYGNWFTKFDSLGMTFTEGGDDLGGFTRIGMQGAPSWYGGLAFTAGGDAEFLSIGAKDYHNDNQDPIPSKLLWARHGIDTYGYNPGWNFEDDVWTDKIGINSIQHDTWNIHFDIVVGSNNFSALTLTSGSGDGFYWGSDGSFGYVTGGNTLRNVKGSQVVYSIGSDGTCQSWGEV